MRLIKSLGQKDDSAQGLIARGDAARDRRAWGKAAIAYRAALEQEADLPDIWVQYGHVLKENRQVGPAVEAYREALSRRPDDTETQVHLAHALKRLALHEEAMEAFEEALRLDPSDQESAEELFSLQRRLNLVPGSSQEAEPDREAAQSRVADRGSPPSALNHQNNLETQIAILKEREAGAANAIRLASLQALHADVQAENDALKEQVKGQQAEIEKRLDQQEELREAAAERDALKDQLQALQEQLDSLRQAEKDCDVLRNERDVMRAERDAREQERDAARAEVESLTAQMRDHDLRADLVREEFLRSEGQITLIKDLFLREGGL